MSKQKLSRAAKKRAKLERLEDPLGINKMSDEEFLENLPKLKKKSALDGVAGFLMFIIVVVLLAVFWDNMF